MDIFYTEDREELLKKFGGSEEDFWKYMSLDDWDYALVINGNAWNNFPERLLTGCCDNTWTYFPNQNKTVGMAYHS
jgi:hypothetical protein